MKNKNECNVHGAPHKGAHPDPGRPLTAATGGAGVAATPLTGNIDAAKSRYE